MQLPPITIDPQRLSALNAKELAEFHKHLHHLPQVLNKALELVNLHLLERERKIGTDDVIVTCELCCGPDADQFFQDAYGPVWQAAKYFTCGIFGLDCSCGGGS